ATALSRRRTAARICSCITRTSQVTALSRSLRMQRSSTRRVRGRRAPRRSTSSLSNVAARPALAGRAPIYPERDVIVVEEKIEMDGEVLEALGSGMFRVVLENGHELIAYTAGKMRRYRIRMAPGDRISVQLSAYDLNRGRIVYRHR